MTIKTLEHTPVSDILNAFNAAFADYLVAMNLTEAAFQQKIKQDDLSMADSVGAFVDGQLVALSCKLGGLFSSNSLFITEEPVCCLPFAAKK